jgi:hypothetical protein
VVALDDNGDPLPVQADEDCDGVIGTEQDPICDEDIAVGDIDPIKAARAIDICKDSVDGSWGLLKAEYVLLSGEPLPEEGYAGVGILPDFGPNVKVQGGQRMLALSSGVARAPAHEGYDDLSGYKGYVEEFPPGYPIESPACVEADGTPTETGEPHDTAALKVTLKVPTNAKSLSFRVKFYTREYSTFICSEYNDFFIVQMDPPPADVDQVNKNITFDSQSNPISVNNAFLEVCDCPEPPCEYGGKEFTCPAGTAELVETGFDTDGATVWLETKANVVGGSTITLLFATFDSGDSILDSTALVDHFRWSAQPAKGTTTGQP